MSGFNSYPAFITGEWEDVRLAMDAINHNPDLDAYFINDPGPSGPEGEETPCPENVIDIIRNWGWFA